MVRIGYIIFSSIFSMICFHSSQDLAYGKNNEERHKKSKKKKSKKKKSSGVIGKVKAFVKNNKATVGAAYGGVVGSIGGPVGSVVGATVGSKIGSMVDGGKHKQKKGKN
jgi:hypothetical protein